MTYESACYIARYVMKKANNYDNKYFEKRNKEPEFVETSRKGGIGYQILKDKKQFEHMKRNMGFFITSKKDNKTHLKKIPNFIRNKWKEYDNYEYYAMNEERTKLLKKNTEEHLKKIKKTPAEYRKQLS